MIIGQYILIELNVISEMNQIIIIRYLLIKLNSIISEIIK